MMKLSWKIWLTIWLAFALSGAGFAWLLWLQGFEGAARGVGYVAFALWAAWLGHGLWTWRDIPWVARITWGVVATVATGLFVQIGRDMGWPGLITVVVGAYAMAATFVGGLMLIRGVLSPGHPVVAVARTLVDEAVRMKLAMVFIVGLVLLLPLLPVVTDGEQMLRYRLQTFLTWSMMATAVLLGLMTIFLSVATITNEVSRRQIFLTLTKPLGRGQYLAGKWLGIALLNLLLVTMCGGGIYVFTLVLSQQPANDAYDARAVEQEVLTAREARVPQPSDPALLQRRYEQRLERRMDLEPHLFGQPGSHPTAEQQRERERLREEVMRQWYTLDPREQTTYVFEGLAAARERGGTLQLRIQPDVGGLTDDGFVYLAVAVNGRPLPDGPVLQLVANTTHVRQVPVQYIEDGRLAVTLHNPSLRDGAGGEREQPSVNFNPEDGFQLLYPVGTFEGNLTRSLMLVWLHLCFLAMLGLAAGSFLSFPSASMLTLTVYVIGATTGYIQSSLESYAFLPDDDMSALEKAMYLPVGLVENLAEGDVGEALRLIVRMVGESAMALVPSLSWFDPTSHLADGQVITFAMVGQGVLWMGLIWGGIAALAGWLIFRRRELAQVTV